MDANAQNVLQLANNRAGVLQCQGQVLAALIHCDNSVPHVLHMQSQLG